MIITINTNGTLIDEEWAVFFKNNKPRRINITLYGGEESTYERLCHYASGYTKAVQAIYLLKKYGVPVKINGSVTKYNKEDINAIYDLGKNLNIPVHIDTYMLPGLHEINLPIEQQSRLFPKDAANIEVLTLKAELSSEAFRNYVKQAIFAIEDRKISFTDHISCMAGNCSFTINWQGNMRPCVSLSYPSVSVFDKGFNQAWREVSKKSKKIKLNKKCIQCSLRPICKTCVASAYLETHKYDGVSEYLCDYAQEFLLCLYKEMENFKDE